MESERLVVRSFKDEDLAEFTNLIRDKMRSEYAPYDEQYPVDDASLGGMLRYFVSSDEFFAVKEKSTGRLVGYMALNVVDAQTRNLGYCLNSGYQHLGYAAEAAGIIIEYARMLGVRRLVSGTALENAPSTRLLGKLHFSEISRSVGSFVNDSHGKPIEFTGCEYELMLG